MNVLILISTKDSQHLYLALHLRADNARLKVARSTPRASRDSILPIAESLKLAYHIG